MRRFSLKTALSAICATFISAIASEIFPNISEQQQRQIENKFAGLQIQYKNGSREDFVEHLMAKGVNTSAAAFNDARLHALLGNRTSALDELEKGVDGNAFGVVFLRADPFFDSLRNEPRYQAILKRMNLPTV
jgi:hypothetical protein